MQPHHHGAQPHQAKYPLPLQATSTPPPTTTTTLMSMKMMTMCLFAQMTMRKWTPWSLTPLPFRRRATRRAVSDLASRNLLTSAMLVTRYRRAGIQPSGKPELPAQTAGADGTDTAATKREHLAKVARKAVAKAAAVAVAKASSKVARSQHLDCLSQLSLPALGRQVPRQLQLASW